MKNYSLKISITFIAIFIVFMVSNVVMSQQNPAANNPYNDPNIGLENMMVQYHTYINDTFNIYTKTLLQSLEKNTNDKYGLALESAEECIKHPENFSTFCLAATLLGGQTGQKGYLNYKEALNLRRNQLFDTSDQKSAYISSQDGTADKTTVQPITQGQKAVEINARFQAIDREIAVSKQALDQTLAAYDQLRMAWPMHKEYKRIFDALVTYRDQIVEIRNQTNQYPSRFIDVTTAKCF